MPVNDINHETQTTQFVDSELLQGPCFLPMSFALNKRGHSIFKQEQIGDAWLIGKDKFHHEKTFTLISADQLRLNLTLKLYICLTHNNTHLKPLLYLI